MNTFLSDKRILVTGGGGFLGTHLISTLKRRGVKESNIFAPKKIDFDLRKQSHCKKAVKNANVVIHLAATVGGIGYNQQNPGTIFYDNILMGVNMMEEARMAGVEKFVAIGTVCAYPKFTKVPFREEDIWDGYPEETNAPYGLAKKMLLVQAQAYRQQYDFNAIYLLPVNLYGPGDNFDEKSSHVIPALIRKFVDAKRHMLKNVVVWGTGTATREFLYVEDAAEAIVLATEQYSKPGPINLGSKFEISIKKLALLVSQLVGYKGEIVFDSTKPDGQPKRKLNVAKARREFGFMAPTDFETGLKKTIQYYTEKYI